MESHGKRDLFPLPPEARAEIEKSILPVVVGIACECIPPRPGGPSLGEILWLWQLFIHGGTCDPRFPSPEACGGRRTLPEPNNDKEDDDR